MRLRIGLRSVLRPRSSGDLVLTPSGLMVTVWSAPKEVCLPRFLSCFCVVILCTATICQGAAQDAGFAMLREGIGARAAAMGEAYTAVAGDQTAAFWNPAGIAALQGKDFLLIHHRSFQGQQQAYGGWAFGNKRRGIALSLAVYSVGGLETRSGPSAEPLGTFSIYEMNAGLSYAQRVGSHLYLGASIRSLHENIGPESAWGAAADLGLLYLAGASGLAFGAAYRNLGRTERLGQERIPLPRTFRAGMAYQAGPAAVSVDYRFPEQGDKGFHFGAEWEIGQALFLRTGYRTGHSTRQVSYGLGLKRLNWRVSYAYVPTDQGLGGSHRLAVGIR